jgi:hypothetical protein
MSDEREKEVEHDGRNEVGAPDMKALADGATDTTETARHEREETVAPEANKENSAFILSEARSVSPLMTDAEARSEMSRKSRRTFLLGSAAAVAGYGGWRWLRSRPEADGLASPFRRAHEFNERVSRAYFSDSRLVRTFPREMAGMPRVNGDIGMEEDFDPAAWLLRVEGVPGELNLTLDDIRALPHVEIVTELKCIEGWSNVVHWAGARFADFAARYASSVRDGYVSLETPGGGYYVGLDMESALHPQTLLCYEMNGVPLTVEHGAPLRLYVPVKYGIKSLKRIGGIRFTNERPRDYWAERGYDWYSGH